MASVALNEADLVEYCRRNPWNAPAHSEALFRTCKYRSDWPTNGFATLERARVLVQQGFVTCSNDEHRHSAVRFVKPSERPVVGHFEISG